MKKRTSVRKGQGALILRRVKIRVVVKGTSVGTVAGFICRQWRDRRTLGVVVEL